MKRVRTSDLQPGMRTAEDIYSYNNQMILPRDTVLTDKMITRLEFYSVLAIRIAEEGDLLENGTLETAPPTVTITPDSPFSQRIKASKEFREFQENYVQTAAHFETELKALADESAQLDVDKLMNTVTGLVGGNMSATNILNMLHNLREYDDVTYMHCMNVSMLANIMGQWLGLGAHDLQVLTIGGLLHDIGKLTVPDEVIHKPAKLSAAEYNIVKTHTVQGYKLLQNYPLEENVRKIALMHHERCDGSGYPLGITADKISPYAKIIAICDVYDAMTAARIYRGPLCPFQVISIFEQEGYQKYDSKFIMTFLEHIAESYMNNRVRLNNGKEGDVVFMNRNALSKPLVQCGTEFVDLSKHPDLFIESFV